MARTSLVAGHVLLPLVAFAVARFLRPDWSTRNLFHIVVFSEAGMLCVWAALSGQSWGRRAVGCLLGLAACWTLLRLMEVKPIPLLLVECLLFPGAATLALTLTIKSSPTVGGDASRWQFTVGQLLIFTTTIAVVIALIQQFWEGNVRVNSRLVMAEGSQISIVVMSWAALGRRWRKGRIAAAAVMVCAVGLTVQSFMSDTWFWDALKNLNRVSAFTLWEDLISIPLAMLVESLFAAATVVVLYVRPSGTRSYSKRHSTL